MRSPKASPEPERHEYPRLPELMQRASTGFAPRSPREIFVRGLLGFRFSVDGMEREAYTRESVTKKISEQSVDFDSCRCHRGFSCTVDAITDCSTVSEIEPRDRNKHKV